MMNRLLDSCFKTEHTTIVEEIMEENNLYWHIFKDTIFYVEGGGMASDIGKIDNHPVIALKEMDGKVWHLLDVQLEGSVFMSINLHERFRKCQIHTAQHLISGMLKNIYNAETLSHHVGVEENDIELNLTTFNEKMMYELQVLCNGLIRDNLEVKISYPTRVEASKYVSEDKLQHDELRVVRIGNLDYNLCGCMHVPSLGYLQMIFIRGFEKTKKGYRIFYLTGDQLLVEMDKRYKVLDEASQSLALGHMYINSGINHLKNEKKELNKELVFWKDKYFSIAANNLINKEDTLIFEEFDGLDVKSVNQLALTIVNQHEKVVVFVTKLYDTARVVIAKNKNIQNFNCMETFAYLKEQFKINGGGNEFMAQGGGMYREDLINYLKTMRFD